MFPLLKPGQTITVEWRGFSDCGQFEVGQVVVYRLGFINSIQTKRVIARAGDLITLAQNNELLRDGLPVFNHQRLAYRLTPIQWKTIAKSLDEESRVRPSHSLLFGESIDMALDSRVFGAIHDDDILGVLTDEDQPHSPVESDH